MVEQSKKKLLSNNYIPEAVYRGSVSVKITVRSHPTSPLTTFPSPTPGKKNWEKLGKKNQAAATTTSREGRGKRTKKKRPNLFVSRQRADAENICSAKPTKLIRQLFKICRRADSGLNFKFVF